MTRETRVAYGETLAKLVKENQNIVVLDADLSKSTKSFEAKKVAPERHFNAGIAESNMMGMAAGLAASGKTVFASTFAVFATGRPFEIIRNSICYPKLNVKICATHAGLSVGEDGASHQAIEDVAIMRAIPNMQVFSPCDYNETKAVIEHVAKIDGPCYVRMGRGKVEDLYEDGTEFDVTKIRVLSEGHDVCLFATGLMVQEAMKAKEELLKDNIDVTVVDVTCLKPIDETGVKEIAKRHALCFALEEHSVIGGLFSALADVLIKEPCTRLIPIGVNDIFGESGKAKDVLEKYVISKDNIVKTVKEYIK